MALTFIVSQGVCNVMSNKGKTVSTYSLLDMVTLAFNVLMLGLFGHQSYVALAKYARDEVRNVTQMYDPPI